MNGNEKLWGIQYTKLETQTGDDLGIQGHVIYNQALNIWNTLTKQCLRQTSITLTRQYESVVRTTMQAYEEWQN